MPPVAAAGGMSGPSTFDKGIFLQRKHSNRWDEAYRCTAKMGAMMGGSMHTRMSDTRNC